MDSTPNPEHGAILHPDSFFMTGTKGSMSSMDLTPIEQAKIDCAEKLFKSISTANVKYRKVATYQDLLDALHSLN